MAAGIPQTVKNQVPCGFRPSAALRAGVEILASADGPGVRVSSDSMAPQLQAGDRVFAEPARARDLSIGDVVLVDWNGLLRAHRFLYRKGRGRVVTKGDAERRLDAPVRSECVVARVTGFERGGRRTNMSAPALRIRGLMNLAEGALYGFFGIFKVR
jgi:hypothetical protein